MSKTSSVLAMTASEAVDALSELGLSVVAMHKTSAPAKQQEGDGLWRVVKVQESSEGVLLTVAWQKTGVTLECDVELGS